MLSDHQKPYTSVSSQSPRVAGTPLLMCKVKCRSSSHLRIMGSWKTWKIHGILKWSFPGLENSWKNLNHKSFGKVKEICSNHVFIYAEFEIIRMFFKERRLEYKPAYAINTLHFLNCSCLYRDFSLFMEIWFKVMEKSWKSICQTV